MDAKAITEYVNSYYKTNQTHVAWSFWASLVALGVGLVVLVVGVSLALAGFSAAIATTTTAAGVFTQFISAGFFYLYNKNLQQLNVFYRELVQNQDMFFAWGLVSHAPEADRAGLVKALIGRILSRGSNPTELTPELVRALNEQASQARAP